MGMIRQLRRATLIPVVLTVVSATGPCLLARQAPAPQFEVASVKVNDAGDAVQTAFGFQPGRFIAVNVTLMEMIRAAWGGLEFQGRDRVVGGPQWINSTRFDVQARFAGSTAQEERLAMVRSLLGERFRVRTHLEEREIPAFALVAVKQGVLGAQFRASNARCVASGPPAPPPPGAAVSLCGVAGGPTGLTGDGASMSQLVMLLSNLPSVGRTVLDRTGLTGVYDFILEYARTPPPASAGDPDQQRPSGGPSIFTALQEQLGLKLEPTRARVEILVIDAAEMPTSD